MLARFRVQGFLMIIITGGFRARPDTIAPLTELCIAHSRRSRTEDGCITHRVFADCEDPLKLFFYEEWADEDALHAHFKVPASNTFVKEARALAAESTGPTVIYGEQK
jgi:quinol monooxygenase YgiN